MQAAVFGLKNVMNRTWKTGLLKYGLRAFHRLTEECGIYDFIRYSALYETVLRYRNPEYIRHLHAELTFYRAVLANRPLRLIFDIGANVGDKAWVFSRLADRVICVEPDPRCVAALRTRFRKSRGVTVEAVALGSVESRGTFHVQDNGSAYNTLSEKHRDAFHGSKVGIQKINVPITTLDRLVCRFGVPDFVKVDVEGFEFEVFSGLSHIIPVISFEANLPLFRDETNAVVTRLLSLDTKIGFNILRAGMDRFLFPALIGPESLRDFIDTAGCVTVDIFAFFGHKAEPSQMFVK